MSSQRERLLRTIGLTDGEEIGPFPFFYEAEITKRTVDAIYFVIKDETEAYEFGPADYPRPIVGSIDTTNNSGHSHSVDLVPDDLPAVGTKIAAAFHRGNPDAPLVLAIYGWPA